MQTDLSHALAAAAEFEHLQSAATAGPWHTGGPYPSVTVIVMVDAGQGWPEPEPPIYDPICYLHQGGPDYDKPPPPQAVANADFIAHARNSKLAQHVRQLHAENARLRAEQMAIEAEQARWQEAIYNALPDGVDGCGCDSGDPLDVSLSEIRQALAQLDDEKGEIEAERDRYRSIVGNVVRWCVGRWADYFSTHEGLLDARVDILAQTCGIDQQAARELCREWKPVTTRTSHDHDQAATAHQTRSTR